MTIENTNSSSLKGLFIGDMYEEYYQSIHHFSVDSELEAILILASMIELLLGRLILKYHFKKEINTLNKIGINSLYYKIRFAFFSDLIDKTAYDAFESIRNIRNCYAHRLSITLDSHKVETHIKELRKKIKIPKELKKFDKLIFKSKIWNNVSELRYYYISILQYLRTLVDAVDYCSNPCSNIIFNDFVNHSEEKTQNILFFDGVSSAYISFEDKPLMDFTVKFIFQFKHSPSCSNKGNIISFMINKNEEILSLSKDMDEDNRFNLYLMINSKKHEIISIPNNNYSNSIEIKFSKDGFIKLLLNNRSLKIFTPDLIEKTISLISIAGNHSIHKPTFGLFSIEVFDYNHEILFEYSATNNSDNRYLKKYGYLRQLIINSFPSNFIQKAELFT
ncbi:hypothetical protein DGMP_06340 [Desulfomarina profundi]|uniref:DUF4145 domain-containing protein n=1 Tax=Desulfomarina profundi TaxID=2772557 RepID=A0A8D5FG01_9BACT|nr:hypothetical protein [Desulfomarina profundi]BCL59941.1 hypothetical protein DGMP_06340 [Desulfomarina profundi]